MSAISLELAKVHMKVDDPAEDELIALYTEAAEQWAGNYIGKPISDLDPLPADIKLAILRLVSFYFESRSLASFGVSMQLAPHSVTSALDAYRDRWFHDGE